jgi:hypothetical protein
MLSDGEVERVCFRTAEILAPDTALPPAVIQAVRAPVNPASIADWAGLQNSGDHKSCMHWSLACQSAAAPCPTSNLTYDAHSKGYEGQMHHTIL